MSRLCSEPKPQTVLMKDLQTGDRMSASRPDCRPGAPVARRDHTQCKTCPEDTRTPQLPGVGAGRRDLAVIRSLDNKEAKLMSHDDTVV